MVRSATRADRGPAPRPDPCGLHSGHPRCGGGLCEEMGGGDRSEPALLADDRETRRDFADHALAQGSETSGAAAERGPALQLAD